MSKGSVIYSSLPKEFKRIGDDALGRGVLPSLFNMKETYQLRAKISDGEYIGFSLYHIKEHTLKNGEIYRIGIIDTVCVATQFRGIGFGTQLTVATLQSLSAQGANRIEILAKRPNEEDIDTMQGVPTFGSDRLLRALGFRKVKTYPQYFAEISEKFGYDCVSCGNTPDSCDGLLYAINDKDRIIIPQ